MYKFGALLMTLALLLAGCGQSPKMSKSEYSDATSLHYQTLNGYNAAIVSRDFLSSGAAAWVEGFSSTESEYGYYQYIISDPEDWNLLVYWPAKNMKKGQVPNPDTMRFSIVENELNIYFEVVEQASADILLLVQGPDFRKWPSANRLYIEGTEVPCLQADFTT